ncbi:hypothetical protein ACJRO7_011323 [Eucalyptus globulus]|uniref:Uncharacterized protein n=1 Tax=Eucalyptus globulus TaxID=34317 RepID=A0ABD3LK95_EUCGL
MARYVNSGYGTPYGGAGTPPTYDSNSGNRTPPYRGAPNDSYDRSYGSYPAKGGVVGTNNYKRDEIGGYVERPYPSPAATPGYGSSGQLYQPSEYGDYSANKDWRKSGGDNYLGEKDEFHYKKDIAMVVPAVIESYVAPRLGHGTGSLSTPTNDIGAAIELLKETATHSSASGSYPRQHQAEAKYAESVSTEYYYPEIMPPTMDPAKRYGNINLGSRRPAAAKIGRNYY